MSSKLELKAAYVIFRHGSRLPLNQNHTELFYNESCKAAELTESGRIESYKNG